jgi:hypothetical protein
LLELRAAEHRRHRDLRNVAGEGIHRRPQVAQLPVAALQLHVVGDTVEGPDEAAVVEAVSRLRVPPERRVRDVQRRGQRVARGFRHMVQVAARDHRLEIHRAVGRKRIRGGRQTVLHAVDRHGVGRRQALCAGRQRDRPLRGIQRRRRHGQAAADRA